MKSYEKPIHWSYMQASLVSALSPLIHFHCKHGVFLTSIPVGYGASGPYSHRAGCDAIAAAEAGMLRNHWRARRTPNMTWSRSHRYEHRSVPARGNCGCILCLQGYRSWPENWCILIWEPGMVAFWCGNVLAECWRTCEVLGYRASKYCPLSNYQYTGRPLGYGHYGHPPVSKPSPFDEAIGLADWPTVCWQQPSCPK